MLKMLRALALLIFLPGLAWAQTSPGLYNGQIPTAAQWNSYFAKKQDYPVSGYCTTGSVFANFTGATAPTRCIPAAQVLGVGSALKWVAPITLTLSGSVSGSGSVDGSGNVTITTSGGATGTVTTTGSPSSGQMAKFSGASSITNAVSGTDFAPATSGSAILKGNGAGGFSSAAAGTDYLAPPSGSAIQAANSGGALTPVTIGAGLSYNTGTHTLTTAAANFGLASILMTNFGGL